MAIALVNRLSTLLILALLSASVVASEEDEIRKTVNRYLDARASGDPNLAGPLFSRGSLEAIEQIRDKAVHADRETLCSMRLSEVVRILVMRARHYRDLPELNAELLAGYGVAQLSFLGDVPRDFEVDILASNTAVAKVASPMSSREHQQFDLVREAGEWRIVLAFGEGEAATYQPIWQQLRAEKGCDAALVLALDLIDKRQYTQLLDPVQ